LESHHSDEPEKGKPTAIWRGVVPILIILFGTLTGLIYTGFDPGVWKDGNMSNMKILSQIIGNSDSFKALVWASFAGLNAAIFFSIPVLGLEKTLSEMMEGFKKMIPAIAILVLAWSLAGLTDQMGTANFVSSVLSGKVGVIWLPAMSFIISGLIAFATGSSWGTMAILYPVLIGLSWTLGLDSGLSDPENYQILLNVISTVLAGSVLGDHCSPISDTTILSSLATDCNHISHVTTQMPYALTVGSVSVSFGTIFSAWGVPVWICFISGVLALYFIVSYFGKLS
jgi:Na+/H+ antiporter NhaC